MKQILSIDIGTSSVRAILVDEKGKLTAIEQKLIHPTYPFHGHIELDPEEIFDDVIEVVEKVIGMSNTRKGEIISVGIANARETTVVWNKRTGKPVWNAILWNDSRSTKYCEDHRDKSPFIKEKTGLSLTSYGSATKIRWILDHAKIENIEECLFGTLNTWVLWKLTGGEVFATDITNASRTLLFNIHEKKWDEDLLGIFGIDKAMLPEVKSCSELYGYTDAKVLNVKIPICAMIGDAQSALFAAGCHDAGEINCCLGTGSFILMNTGEKAVIPKSSLITSIAYQRKGAPVKYCLEGAILSSGSVVEWLKSHTGIIHSAKEIEGLAYSVPDSGGVFFVPTLNGISSPNNGERVRGCIFGISSNTNIGHICRALIEGIGFMIHDIFELLNQEYLDATKTLKCSGGVAENNFLLQMTSDLIRENIVRPKDLELSAFGAAYLAGLAVGVWKDEKEIKGLFKADREFSYKLEKEHVDAMIYGWNKALKAAFVFSDIAI